MLAWIQHLGHVGHTTSFTVSIDGDGLYQIQLSFNNKETEDLYNQANNEIKQEVAKINGDIKSFSLE